MQAPKIPSGPDIFALRAAGVAPPALPMPKQQPNPQRFPEVLNDHIGFFEEVGNAPDKPGCPGGGGEKPGSSSVAEAIHREEREEEVQGRYEQQQTTYAGAASQKHKYGILLKKQIRKFNTVVRNFRRALVDLRKAQHSKEPTYLAASVGRLVDASSMITEHIHELLSQAQHIKSFDVQIKSASSLVKREELRPEDVTADANRELLNSTTQVKIANRSAEALDSGAAMDVGHYEIDWAAEACKDGLDLLGEGMGMVEGILQENGDQDRQRRAGSIKEANPHAASYREYELAYAGMAREHGSLRAALKQLTG